MYCKPLHLAALLPKGIITILGAVPLFGIAPAPEYLTYGKGRNQDLPLRCPLRCYRLVVSQPESCAVYCRFNVKGLTLRERG